MSHLFSTHARRAAAAWSALILTACGRHDLTAPTTPRDGGVPSAAPALSAAASNTWTAMPATLNTDWVEPTGRHLRVPAGGDLQAAIDSAQGGDVILLDPGAEYRGNFRLRSKPAGTRWITITTDTPLPAPGTRMTPALAAPLAKLVAATGEPVIMTRRGAHHYRVAGVEITTSPTRTILASTLVALGYGDSQQTTADSIPHHLTLDRVYVHGHPQLEFQRCIALNSASSAVVDSYVSECHSRYQDSQAIAGWNGPGPYKISNNYLEGATENVMFGGAKIYVPGQLPRDIEISRNHFCKPLAWREVWLAKNLLELKAAQRVLIEGNVFENSWVDGQTGYGLLIKSSGVSSNPWVETRDVYMRWNVVRNVAGGIAINDDEGYNQPAHGIRVAQNLFDGVGRSNGTFTGRAFMLTGALRDLAFVHNTVVPNATSGTVWVFDAGRTEVGAGLFVTDNVTVKGAYGMVASGAGDGTTGLDRYFTSWTWENNIQVGFTASKYPASNFEPRTVDDVGFADYAGGNYRLAPASPYAGTASDGTDPGADIDRVLAHTAGVAAPVVATP